MKIGVSTASLYPLHIEDAFFEIASRGINTAEVFLNSLIEQDGPPMERIIELQKEYGIEICSFHPFSSPMETVYLFSSYDRRIDEMLDMYKRNFETMNKLGAKIFVLHGAMQSSHCTDEHYFNQFNRLSEIAKRFDITVAQENICYCKSKSIDFLKNMREQLKDDFKMVCDLKQARRSGLDVYDIINEFGKDIIHYHISDADERSDCLPVGKGKFDFDFFVSKIRKYNYNGKLIVELYRENYDKYDELKKSVVILEKLISKIE